MRFSFFAVLPGLAALAVVNALPTGNLQTNVLSEDVAEPVKDAFSPCCTPNTVSLIFLCQRIMDVHYRSRLLLFANL